MVLCGEPLEPQNVIGRPTDVTRARRWIFAALFLLAGIVLVTWATRTAWLALSAYTDFWADQELCEGTSPDVDAQIAACTRQIGSGHFWGHDLAIEHYNRGIAWKATGDFDHAITDYTEAIRLDPEDADNFNLRCWGRALDGKDLNGALAGCNESLRLRPNDGNILNSRGLVQFKLGAFDAAIADYNAAVAQNAKDADSLYSRGVAKLKKGDTAGGNADIAAAKAIKPDVAVVSAGYGITVDATGANAAPEHK